MSEIRIGDAERSSAVAQLEQHAAAGRLAPDELAERRAQAQSAVYDVDLDALFRDLPGGFTRAPQQRWDVFPGVASGVSDGPGTGVPPRTAEPLSGPVLTQPVEYRVVGRPRRLNTGGVSVGSVVFFIGLMLMLSGARFGWLIFMIGMFLGPLLGSIGRRRP